MSPFATQYAEVLAKASLFPTLICDRDHVVSASGVPKKEYLERRITASLEDIMESRQNFISTKSNNTVQPIEGVDRDAAIICPILSSGDVIGSVIMLATDDNVKPTETEIKLAHTAAAFLGKQMEE